VIRCWQATSSGVNGSWWCQKSSVLKQPHSPNAMRITRRNAKSGRRYTNLNGRPATPSMTDSAITPLDSRQRLASRTRAGKRTARPLRCCPIGCVLPLRPGARTRHRRAGPTSARQPRRTPSTGRGPARQRPEVTHSPTMCFVVSIRAVVIRPAPRLANPSWPVPLLVECLCNAGKSSHCCRADRSATPLAAA
jgi:hypothetical protein